MTSEALDGQLQSCYTARARPKYLTEEKCFRLRLNRARELQHEVSVFREFQTAGAEDRNARSVKRVLVVGLCSMGICTCFMDCCDRLLFIITRSLPCMLK